MVVIWDKNHENKQGRSDEVDFGGQISDFGGIPIFKIDFFFLAYW